MIIFLENVSLLNQFHLKRFIFQESFEFYIVHRMGSMKYE